MAAYVARERRTPLFILQSGKWNGGWVHCLCKSGIEWGQESGCWALILAHCSSSIIHRTPSLLVTHPCPTISVDEDVWQFCKPKPGGAAHSFVVMTEGLLCGRHHAGNHCGCQVCDMLSQLSSRKMFNNLRNSSSLGAQLYLQSITQDLKGSTSACVYCKLA